MTIFTVISCIFFIIYLLFENYQIKQDRKSIPLCIAVTGTRGKTSITRILASILRESNKKTLAKTTGSEPCYILPDGKQEKIKRTLTTSIIEQKKLLKKAAKIRVDCVVSEIMSLRPENHYIESQRIIKPDILIITNVRNDHIDAMGKTKNQIAKVFCLDIFYKTNVFLPKKEKRDCFLKAVKNKNGKSFIVKKVISEPLFTTNSGLFKDTFQENIDLIYRVCKYLNIKDGTIIKGFKKVKYDIGNLKLWQYKTKSPPREFILVNAFGANDPESTSQIISRLIKSLPLKRNKFIGLLNLRWDRGDRTSQWINYLKTHQNDYFKKLYVMGGHSSIVKRKLRNIVIINKSKPENIMNQIIQNISEKEIILGFGNIKNRGLKLINYWNKIGVNYEL